MKTSANKKPHVAKSSMRAKSQHEIRVDFLDSLAVLMGYTASLVSGFPDGKRPDVLRINMERGSLFIGDAKDTELPGNKETQVRLLNYIKWLAVQVNHRGKAGMFALCVKPGQDIQNWVSTVLWLGKEAGISNIEIGIEIFDCNIAVVWFINMTNREEGGVS